MKYDFISILDRKGKDAIAVEEIPFENVEVKEGYSRIPMWVADMNFPVVPTIQEEIIARTQHPAFGYFNPREEYYDSIIQWQKEQNQVVELKKEQIGYENSVLGGVASAVQAFTSPGEAILLHSPTYIGFTGTLKNNGRKIILSDLIKDEAGIWRINYQDMEEKIQRYKIHFCIFCSPHNPTGRVWEEEELQKVMDICRKNDCIVVSDEIWSDLTLENHHHIPTQSISEDAKNRTIALYAPSKTFNLAGLIGSYHIIYNPYLKDRMDQQASLSHYNNMNVLSMYALIGAYRTEGKEWLKELRQVLEENVNYACDYIEENFPGIEVSKPQGTYMLFLDCRKWCEEKQKSLDELIRAGMEHGVIWQDGRAFHGEYSIRMNLALPLSLVKEAMERLKAVIIN